MLNKHLAIVLSSFLATGLLADDSTAKKEEKKPAQPAAKAPAKKPEPKPAPAKKKGKTKKRRRGTPPLLVARNNQVGIPKDALGREYLMSASMIPQAQVATSRGLAGKIVRFELFHDGVDLYESTEGLVVTDDLPARRLITTFPIVARDGDVVVIDFNKGMSRVFMEIWYANSSRFDAGLRDQVAEVPRSRVFSVKRDKDALVIRQSAQVRDRRYSQNEEGRYELRYFFHPYTRKKFTAKENSVEVERHARFFETQPQLEKTSGRTTVKIARFDLKKPVQFYYSANTPPDYVQAIKDGVLYWNRAFGKEVVKVGKAPRGVTAPASGHNVVQWVPWDSAGFAYADVLIDPRTGESRHGQAYMTSVFAIAGKARARALLRAMQKVAEEKKDDGDKDGYVNRTKIRFPGSTVCQVDRREFARRFAADLENLLATEELTDEAVLRASQDYVREVAAHEVGHVLGLRHNFAGSLAATLNHKELDDWFKAYVKGDDLSAWKDKLTSSSMMEYTVFKGAVFTGWLMRSTDRVLPHDKAAIRWGYFDDKQVIKDKMLFGTDDHVGGYGDLHRFDYGTEPVVGGYAEIANYIDGLPEKVIEEFIRARAPFDPRDRVPLEAVNLSVRSYASPIATELTGMLSWLKSGTRSLKLEREFEFIGDLNKKERVQAHWKSLNDQVTKLGGVDRAFFSFLPIGLKLALKDPAKGIRPAAKVESAKLAAELEKLLDSPAYTEFVGLDEKNYKFTDDEKKIIVARGQKLFTELEEEVLKQVLAALERATRDIGFQANQRIDDNDLIAQFEKRVHALAETVITTKDPKRRINGRVAKSEVTITDYKYNYAVRTSAAKALTDTVGSFKNWATEAKAGIHAKVKADYEAQLNTANLKSFKDSMLSRPLREWYVKQITLLRLLPPAKTAPPAKK